MVSAVGLLCAGGAAYMTSDSDASGKTIFGVISAAVAGVFGALYFWGGKKPAAPPATGTN